MSESVHKTDRFIRAERHQGLREYQEDDFRICIGRQRILAIVADGMGGHSHGAVASRMLVEQLQVEFGNHQSVHALLCGAVQKTITAIQQSGKNMGCTFAAAVITKEDHCSYLYYTWIGDSRIYLETGENCPIPSDNAEKITAGHQRVLWLLTGDDTFVWGLHVHGELDIDAVTRHPEKNQLEISLHSWQNGVSDIVKKRIRRVPLYEGDKIFLCTDGVWETFTAQAKIMHYLKKDPGESYFCNHCKPIPGCSEPGDNATYIRLDNRAGLFELEPVIMKPGDIPDTPPPDRKSPPTLVVALLSILLFLLLFLFLVGQRLFAGADPNTPGEHEKKGRTSYERREIICRGESLYSPTPRNRDFFQRFRLGTAGQTMEREYGRIIYGTKDRTGYESKRKPRGTHERD